jgi:hypothetical protein
MRDLEVIDSEFRLLLAIRRMAASRRVGRSTSCWTNATGGPAVDRSATGHATARVPK